MLLELIIDPACSLVFEAEPLPPDGMKRPPRAADTRLFDTAAILLLAPVAAAFGLPAGRAVLRLLRRGPAAGC